MPLIGVCGGYFQFLQLGHRERLPHMSINGTIKFFNHSRGFGFISPEDGGKDVFVHVTALERSGIPSVEEGDKLSFELEDDRRGRGKQATNLQLA
jgi:CspA family cold shock protein